MIKTVSTFEFRHKWVEIKEVPLSSGAIYNGYIDGKRWPMQSSKWDETAEQIIKHLEHMETRS